MNFLWFIAMTLIWRTKTLAKGGAPLYANRLPMKQLSDRLTPPSDGRPCTEREDGTKVQFKECICRCLTSHRKGNQSARYAPTGFKTEDNVTKGLHSLHLLSPTTVSCGFVFRVTAKNAKNFPTRSNLLGFPNLPSRKRASQSVRIMLVD